MWQRGGREQLWEVVGWAQVDILVRALCLPGANQGAA